MPFDPETGMWTDGFGDTKPGLASQVPALDTGGQLDSGTLPEGGVMTTPSGSPSAGAVAAQQPAPVDSLPPPPPNAVEGAATSVTPQSDVAPPAGVSGGGGAADPSGGTAYMGPGSPYLNDTQSLPGLTRQRIMDLLNTPQDVTAESVATSPEMQAARLQSEDSTRKLRAQSAEQAAYNGTSASGGQEGIQRGITEKQGINDAISAGMIASNLRQQKIAELTQGIEFALRSGQFDQADKLQRDLAAINQQEHSDSLGLGYTQLQAQVNRDALIAALGL